MCDGPKSKGRVRLVSTNVTHLEGEQHVEGGCAKSLVVRDSASPASECPRNEVPSGDN